MARSALVRRPYLPDSGFELEYLMVEVKIIFIDGSFFTEKNETVDDWMKKASKIVSEKGVFFSHPNAEGVSTFYPYHQILRFEVRTLKDENP